jgi:hypothetical protein
MKKDRKKMERMQQMERMHMESIEQRSACHIATTKRAKGMSEERFGPWLHDRKEEWRKERVDRKRYLEELCLAAESTAEDYIGSELHQQQQQQQYVHIQQIVYQQNLLHYEEQQLNLSIEQQHCYIHNEEQHSNMKEEQQSRVLHLQQQLHYQKERLLQIQQQKQQNQAIFMQLQSQQQYLTQTTLSSGQAKKPKPKQKKPFNFSKVMALLPDQLNQTSAHEFVDMADEMFEQEATNQKKNKSSLWSQFKKKLNPQQLSLIEEARTHPKRKRKRKRKHNVRHACQ